MSNNESNMAEMPARQPNKAVALKEYLSDKRVVESITRVLPQHMKADRLVRIALQAASRTPALLECTRESFVLALVSAAQLGLEAGGLLGSAYLVPYRNKNGNREVQLIPGYRGLIDLARRSGAVKKIEARVVRKGDEFRLDYGAERITHVPATTEDADDPGSGDVGILGAYAVATLSDGEKQFEFMSRAEIDAIRRRSRAANDGPWVTDYSEMARKTVVRRLAKYLPLSAELARAMEIEDNAESGGALADVMDVVLTTATEPAAPQSKTDALARKLASKKKLEDAPDPDGPDACLEEPEQQKFA